MYFEIMRWVLLAFTGILLVFIIITLKKLLNLTKAANKMNEQAEPIKAKAEKVKEGYTSLMNKTKKTASLASKGLAVFVLLKAVFDDYNEAEGSGVKQVSKSTAHVLENRAVRQAAISSVKNMF